MPRRRGFCPVARRLDPEEAALWRRVVASVRPLPGKRRALPHPAPLPPVTHLPGAGTARPLPPRALPAAPAPSRPVRPPAPLEQATLDGGWDRRLAGGRLVPDRVVDLHGLTLEGAHDRVRHEVRAARADGLRVVLLVTGRPPRAGPDGGRRGLIRGQVMHWLAAGDLADAIAAVRPAHSRHGGAGALYLVLRRNRAEKIP